MKKFFNVVLAFITLAALLTGCGGGGGGGDTGGGSGGATTTTVSGKVTLSGSASAKPSLYGQLKYNPSITGVQLKQVLTAAGLQKSLTASPFIGVKVQLYDADRPEWLYPVAEAEDTVGDGSFTLSVLKNKGLNNATYTDGAAIPAGNYTLIAFDPNSVTTGVRAIAVSAVVKNFAGAIDNVALEAQDSDAVPTVGSMFGLSKNTDGTYGSTTTLLPPNAAVQITFSMAMARLSVQNGIKLYVANDSTKTAIPGKWMVSPDLKSATFAPTSALLTDTVYAASVAGGSVSNTVKNIYGNKLAASVTGQFKTKSTADTTPPTAIAVSPDSQTDVKITTPIRFAANEPVDINTVAVSTASAAASIGDKPLTQYVGMSTQYGQYKYVYEIVPANPLNINTDYAIAVSGAKDLAGNAMATLNFAFKTETTSVGITGTGTAADAQLAIKDVIGKWIGAMNARNISLLSSYMTGDFVWMQDPTHMSSEDRNHDGRLSLNEFTAMLTAWFKQLDQCGTTMSGDIVDNPDLTADGIVLYPNSTSPTSATVTFSLTGTSTNTNDSSCSEVGSPGNLFGTMRVVSGSWLLAGGSDSGAVSALPAPLAAITLGSPATNSSLPEPTAQPLQPDFSWTGVAGVASYAVVVVDTRDINNSGSGWVAIVDGAGTAGTTVTARFSPTTGYTGNVYVLPQGKAFGFWNMLKEYKSGGAYNWAVLGFGTKTVADFAYGVDNPVADLVASSDANNFSVLGTWRELGVTVKDSTGKIYDKSLYGGNDYNVGNASQAVLVITTPDITNATGARVGVSGYTWQEYSSPFDGSGTATVTIDLSNTNNYVEICDNYAVGTNGPGSCNGFSTRLNINTTGGALPQIVINPVISGTTTAAGAATITGPDSWKQYTSPDVAEITLSVTVKANSNIPQLWVSVYNESGNGQFSTSIPLTYPSAADQTVSVTGIKVFTGRNGINLSGNSGGSINHQNRIGIEALVGGTYVPPITITGISGGAVKKSESSYDTYWDLAAGSTVTITGNFANFAPCSGGGCGWSQQIDPNFTWITGGPLSFDGSGNFSVGVTLYNGWNYLGFADSQNNYYQVFIYAADAGIYTPPHVITSITGGPTPLTPTPSYSSYPYDAGSACSVTIDGQTTTNMDVTVNMNYYNSVTNQSVYQWDSVPVSGTGPYTYSYTVNVYGGNWKNDINFNDGNYWWQGANVTTTCSTPLVVFGVTQVKNFGAVGSLTMTDGWYNTTAAKLTVSGTAKYDPATSNQVTVYVSGQYYETYTAAIQNNNTFTIDLPIYNGYNYISLTDGNNWAYADAYTTGGTVYTAPIYNVKVGGNNAISGGSDSDSWGNWETAAATVTITGNAAAGAGSWSRSGTYNFDSGPLDISTGTFSVTMDLDQGNNNISLYDASGNVFYASIFTSGGYEPIKAVSITSPAHNGSTTVSATVPVTFTIDGAKFMDSAGTPATVGTVYGYVYDYTTSVSTYYSNDAIDIAEYGYLPITYNAATGAFSFNAVLTGGNMTDIQVWAYDTAWTVSHGDDITLNNYSGYGEYFWKPTAKPSAMDARAKAHKAEFMKRMQKKMNR